MQSFVIEGGRPLSGTVRAAGNKNGALPILAACVLASEPVRLTNLPRIRDVQTMLELLADVGAEVEWTGENEALLDTRNVTKTELDEELCRRIRASFLLAGPMLARFGRVTVPPPGGDVIGRRRLDPHIHALAELGAEIVIDHGFEMRAGQLRGRRVFLDEASVIRAVKRLREGLRRPPVSAEDYLATLEHQSLPVTVAWLRPFVDVI